MSDFHSNKRPSEILLEQAKAAFDSLGIDPSHKQDLDDIVNEGQKPQQNPFNTESKGFTV